MGIVDRPNKVPALQRMYQAAYYQHTRLWKINPRSRWYLTPYLFLLWGTFGATIYASVRRAAGYNTWFSSS
ncbi:hypothetical protein VUR80DRAFT_9212 [Thermomyces stellatus]